LLCEPGTDESWSPTTVTRRRKAPAAYKTRGIRNSNSSLEYRGTPCCIKKADSCSRCSEQRREVARVVEKRLRRVVFPDKPSLNAGLRQLSSKRDESMAAKATCSGKSRNAAKLRPAAAFVDRGTIERTHESKMRTAVGRPPPLNIVSASSATRRAREGARCLERRGPPRRRSELGRLPSSFPPSRRAVPAGRGSSSPGRTVE
jgi:hypothetical protein